MKDIGVKLFGIIRNVQKVRHIGTTSRLRSSSYDAPGRTTATILNSLQKETVCINECDSRGFTLNNDTVVIGPMAAFPRTILNWNVGCATDINEESLSLFLTLEPRVELLVIGLEKHHEYQEVTRIKDILRKAKIPSEVLPVMQALAVFNFAAYEGRYVAGGFIPPLDYFKNFQSRKQEIHKRLES